MELDCVRQQLLEPDDRQALDVGLPCTGDGGRVYAVEIMPLGANLPIVPMFQFFARFTRGLGFG